MKKIISVLLALVLTLGCALALTSCGEEPELDFDTAAKMLKASGYTVSINDGSFPDISEVLHAKDNTSEFELYIYRFNDESLAKSACSSFEDQVEREIEEKELEIKMLEHAINNYANDYSSAEIREMRSEIDELREEISYLEDEAVVGRSGSYIWVGSRSMVAATKG